MRIILAYKNFAANKHISHIGLGVAAVATQKELLSYGYDAHVWPITSALELRQRINLSNSRHHHEPRITHVIISAPWIPTKDMQDLCNLFPHIQFVMCSHSNVGFLQADFNGVRLIREALELEMFTANFRVAGNSEKFCHWIRQAYGRPCLFLPNLYHLHQGERRHRPRWKGGVLRIGIFGAVRALKNGSTAVGAAIQIAKDLGAETQIWMSTGRTEGGGDVVMRSVQEMVRGVDNVSLHAAGWRTWPQFRALVGSMHLLLQPSYTESFNMVTADGVAEGVPSVVSAAIDWVPSDWIAHFDDVNELAQTGKKLLRSRCAARRGKKALEQYVRHGIKHYARFFALTS